MIPPTYFRDEEIDHKRFTQVKKILAPGEVMMDKTSCLEFTFRGVVSDTQRARLTEAGCTEITYDPYRNMTIATMPRSKMMDGIAACSMLCYLACFITGITLGYVVYLHVIIM